MSSEQQQQRMCLDARATVPPHSPLGPNPIAALLRSGPTHSTPRACLGRRSLNTPGRASPAGPPGRPTTVTSSTGHGPAPVGDRPAAGSRGLRLGRRPGAAVDASGPRRGWLADSELKSGWLQDRLRWQRRAARAMARARCRGATARAARPAEQRCCSPDQWPGS